MARVKSAVMDGEEFACDNYNVSREEFIMMTNIRFGKGSIEAGAALHHFDIIQGELDDYFDRQYDAMQDGFAMLEEQTDKEVVPF